MAPFIVLVAVTIPALFLAPWPWPLRLGLAAMFLLTASAHRGRRRPMLLGMVPPRFPRPDLLVTATGVLELLGAVGLLIPATSRLAAAGLALLMIAMFPANVYAARHVPGSTPLGLRTVLQVVFVAAAVAVAVG